MTFLKALLEHVMLPNETLGAFREQLKALTETDKTELKEAFAREGVVIDS